MKSKILAATAGLGFALFVGSAAAAPTYCSETDLSDNADGLSRDNVTFRTFNSDGCYGVVSGNDSLSGAPAGWDVNTLESGLFDGGWAAYAKDDASAGSVGYLGLTWTVSAPQESNGNPIPAIWTLTVADPTPVNLPVTADLLVVLKASNSWGAFFFDDETFSLAGANAGTFQINFENNGGKFPGLSHMTLYLREGTPPPPPCTGDNCGDVTIPEPATLALMGMGLAAFGIARRRRQV